MGYLPKEGVSFELIEFQSGARTVQGGLFGPDPKLFHKPDTAVVLVHGVESYWYSGPTMFLGCYLAEAGYAALAYNGVIGTALGFWAMTVVNRRLPAATASLGLLATPVLGIGLSTVILGEKLDPILILSTVIILTGIALGTTGRKRLR